MRTSFASVLRFAHRKTPWRLSVTRKANVRGRLKKVDAVIEAVRASGVQCEALVCPQSRFTIYNLRLVQTNALALPKEHEMDPKDKYTVFSRHHRGYRKGIHKVPKWTRVCALSPPSPHICPYISQPRSPVDYTENKPERVLDQLYSGN
jgi:hypothetical protein